MIQLFQARSRFCRSALILSIGLIIIHITACQKRPKNIVIVSIDTLNSSSLKAFNPQAPDLPTLDLFAKQSAVFARAYSSASWTLPAHGSLFTGLYPDRHGAVHKRLKLSSSIPTLARLLKQAGFYTVAFTDGGWLSRFYGFSEGFDYYNDWVNPEVSWQMPPVPRNGKINKPRGLRLFDRGIEFIKGWKNVNQGFFLFLHTFIVHDYFKVHPWAVNRLPTYLDKGENYNQDCLQGIRACPPEDWERLKALYQEEVRRVDEGFCRFLTALDNRGLRESTLIIFISDHGEGFDPARGRIHHGGRLHQDVIHIPILINGPGIRPCISNTPISLVDIMPTVLDLCGFPIPPKLDGNSFAADICGKAVTPSRTIYAMEHYHTWIFGRRVNLRHPPNEPFCIAVIRGEYWYLRDLRGGVEIYHMGNDPLQTRNLALESPFISELSQLAEKRNIYRPSAPTFSLNKEIEDQLRSLGYID